MVTHPIHVGRNNYRGADARKKAKTQTENRDASQLEQHVNAMLLAQTEPIKVYFWGEISRDSGMSYDTVARLGFSIDGGSGGFTAWRHDMTYEQAMEAHNKGNSKT
ncbi:hypothetical protein [Polaromonas sp.]|uniref:hypothetical protein n=1 Tax=Polaromonas sp. TaxID=1869339 RepID=UPI00352AE032